MHKISKLKNWTLSSPACLAISAFSLVACIGIGARPKALERLFTDLTPAFDGNIYYLIALHGYGHSLTDQALTGLPAFYPMWPLVLRSFWALTGTTGSVAVATSLSLTCFAISLVLLARLLGRFASADVSRFILLAFALNPISVFHATLYSESWFGLICALWLLAIVRCFEIWNWKRCSVLLFATAILSLSRPILMPALAALVALLAVEFFRPVPSSPANDPSSNRLRPIIITVVIGLCLGYLPYGIHNLNLFGDFFHPFRLQSLWGRSLSFNWQLIYAPKTVSGSVHVLFWDLVAFYLPIVLVAYGALRFFGPNQVESGLQRFCLWFGVFCAGAHAAIAFLTYPIFMSLGRHNLASPLLYVSLAVFLTMVPIGRKTQIAILLICAAHSVHFWARLARGAWMG
jgi:hypothetical protein